MSKQELLDGLVALGNQLHALGLQEGQSGGALYSQAQLDQAVADALAAEKARVLAGLPAINQAEEALVRG
jgi:hypothetical protein